MQPSLLCLLAVTVWCGAVGGYYADSDNARQLYREFKRKYGKNYANEDDEVRFTVFKSNLVRAQLFQELEQGTAKYGVTQFSDLTAEEFESKYLRMQYDEKLPIYRDQVLNSAPLTDDSFDWREHGAVGPVQDQGQCGSCWAFSVIGNVEGQWFRKTGKLLKLSEQQLVDCDKFDHGCDGGYPPETYKQIELMGGLELLRDYPYEADDMQCQMDRSKFNAYVNASQVFPEDENLQAKKLKQTGPLSSALNAFVLQFYRGGIIHVPTMLCNPSGLNHAVLTVGYGTERAKPYWVVRNSWGTSFGEQGYFRIFRGAGTCGINKVVSTAIIN